MYGTATYTVIILKRSRLDCFWGDFYYLGCDLSENCDLGLERGVLAQSRLSFSSLLGFSLDIRVVLRSSFGSLGGEFLNQLLALPTDLSCHIAKNAELSLGLQTKASSGLGDRHLLLLVIRSWHTLEDLKALQSGLTSGSLVGKHTAKGPPEEAGRGPEVERASSRVGVHSLLDELGELYLISGDGTRDDHGLAAHNDDLLAQQKLLGNNGSQTT